MKRIVPVLLTVFLFSVLVLDGCSGDSSGTSTTGQATVTSARVGEAAPDFQLDSLDGKKVSLRSFKGKPVLINFWATWCGPCVGEMPLLQEVYSEYSTRDLIIIGVNSGESASKVSGFMQRYEYTFPVVLDINNETAITYNVKYLPTTFFLDKDGIIRKITLGAFESKEAIIQAISEISPAK